MGGVWIMKKSFKIILKAVAMICLISMVLCGCTQTGTPRTPENDMTGLARNRTPDQGLNQNDMVGNRTRTGLGQGDLVGTDNRAGQTFDNAKANRIKRELEKINGLTETNVLVMGDTCIVGYRANAATGNTTDMRDRITRAVKKVDGTITNVLVSESADVIERIKRLGAGVTNGIDNNGLDRINNGMTRNTTMGMNRRTNGTTGNKVGNTIMDEFNDLVRTLTPPAR